MENVIKEVGIYNVPTLEMWMYLLSKMDAWENLVQFLA